MTLAVAARGSLSSFLSFGNQFRLPSYRGGGRSKRGSMFSLYESQNHQLHQRQDQEHQLQRNSNFTQPQSSEPQSLGDQGDIPTNDPTDKSDVEAAEKTDEFPNHRAKEQAHHPHFNDNAV